MKRFIVITVILLFCSLSASAQSITYIGTHSPVSTQSSDARYEFIQSTSNSSQAFLIDKYTGKVWRYKIGKKTLEEILIDDADKMTPDKVNYQLYISSSNSSMCFLLNVHTGNMWRYASQEGEKTFKKIDMPWENRTEQQ